MASQDSVCSFMFTDLNIKVMNQQIKNCCKTSPSFIDESEIDQLGPDIFLRNAEYLSRKTSMVRDQQLPMPSCGHCVNTKPHNRLSMSHWSKQMWSDSADDLIRGDRFNTYEMVLSSACDLKCVYCHPKDSSSWAKELGVPMARASDSWKQKIMQHFLTYMQNKVWDQETYNFYISGGEPTYNPETLEFMHTVASIVPHRRLRFILTTNLNTKDAVLDRYMELVHVWPEVRWRYDCSLDDYGDRCAAIRYGLDWTQSQRNITRMLQQPQRAMVLLCPTPSILSIPTMPEFIRHFHLLFAEHGRQLSFSQNMVMEDGLSLRNLTPRFKTYLDQAEQYCRDHGIEYTRHINDMRQLLGTRTGPEIAQRIRDKMAYFQRMRPDTDWFGLFPHIPSLLDELESLHASH